jgi:rod shape-determining protein MreC
MRAASAVVELIDVRMQNQDLRRLATQLMLERQELAWFRHENERLRGLLELLASVDDYDRSQMIPATVIGIAGSRIVEGILIDKGRSHEVEPDMAVVVPEGLVGKIRFSGDDKAAIEAMASPRFGVSVAVERDGVAGERGVVRPRHGLSMEPVIWIMDYVPAKSDIRKGDKLVTTGLGGVYPRGLLVGHVTSVREGPLEMEITVKPAVDIYEIEQVFVLARRDQLKSDHSLSEDERKRQQELVEELERTIGREEFE